MSSVRVLEDFVIPELPVGQQMVINIKTTWGDQHYVGLTGLEIFASTGLPVPVAKVTNSLFNCLFIWLFVCFCYCY